MLVWGGQGEGGALLLDGGRYNPATDSWKPIPAAGGPGVRAEFATVWAGFGLVVWGGNDPGPGQPALNTGYIYVPAQNQWRPMSLRGAPSARRRPTAVWTGREVISWGGAPVTPEDNTVCPDGARYNPFTDTWTPMSTGPEGRCAHTALWIGSEMLVWGGMGRDRQMLNTGARYNPRTDRWTPMEIANAPSPRMASAAAWTGQGLLLYSGFTGGFKAFNTTHYYLLP
jgi:N-acetylneuraminic acid mutarotase